MKSIRITRIMTAAAIAFVFSIVTIEGASALDTTTLRASEKGRYVDNDSRLPVEKSRFESPTTSGTVRSQGYANMAAQSSPPRASEHGRYVDNDSRVGVEKQRYERHTSGNVASYTGYSQPRASDKGPYLENGGASGSVRNQR